MIILLAILATIPYEATLGPPCTQVDAYALNETSIDIRVWGLDHFAYTITDHSGQVILANVSPTPEIVVTVPSGLEKAQVSVVNCTKIVTFESPEKPIETELVYSTGFSARPYLPWIFGTLCLALAAVLIWKR